MKAEKKKKTTERGQGKSLIFSFVGGEGEKKTESGGSWRGFSRSPLSVALTCVFISLLLNVFFLILATSCLEYFLVLDLGPSGYEQAQHIAMFYETI